MATTRYTTFGGEVVSENRDGVMRDYVPDSLGSTVALLDNIQTQSDTFTYWPYGEVRTRSGTTGTPFLFRGAKGNYTDLTGRVYTHGNYFNPHTTSWLTQAPAPPRGKGKSALPAPPKILPGYVQWPKPLPGNRKRGMLPPYIGGPSLEPREHCDRCTRINGPQQPRTPNYQSCISQEDQVLCSMLCAGCRKDISNPDPQKRDDWICDGEDRGTAEMCCCDVTGDIEGFPGSSVRAVCPAPDKGDAFTRLQFYSKPVSFLGTRKRARIMIPGIRESG